MKEKIFNAIGELILAIKDTMFFIFYKTNSSFTIDFDILEKAKLESGLKVLHATYGRGDKQVYVTSILKSKISDNQIRVKVDNNLFTDSARFKQKELKVLYSYKNEINTIVTQENNFLELPISEEHKFSNYTNVSFDTLHDAKSSDDLKVLYAVYGKDHRTKDVVSILNDKIVDNKLKIKIQEEVLGDPSRFEKKELKAIYTLGKKINTVVVHDNEYLDLPIK